MIDGILATANFRDGKWQGFQKEDLIETIDLGEEYSPKKISINFLSDQGS
ncbi:MAG: hypothetical protein ABIJ40_07995 [Bacteroidota bacterium]